MIILGRYTARGNKMNKCKEKLVIEYEDINYEINRIIALVKQEVGKKRYDVINVYFQPETGMIYYIIDGEEGSTSLVGKDLSKIQLDDYSEPFGGRNPNDKREIFYNEIHLPQGFVAKRYKGMNRVHLKYNSKGFAVVDMNKNTYNLATRAKLYDALHVNNYEYTNNMGPNHAIVKSIDYSNKDILYKLIDFISSNSNIFEFNDDVIKMVSSKEVEASEIKESQINRGLYDLISLEEKNFYSFEYISRPEKRKDVNKSDNSSGPPSYPRDPHRKINALIRADFKCEINPEHASFISRKTGKSYMEPHHLIPLEYWESFENSLDVEANIVCLCSNCHNEIHYGKYAAELIRPLYEKRKDELHSAGINIDIDSLVEMYEGDYINKI